MSRNQENWEQYNRETFLAHTKNIPPEKLRFLTYVTPKTLVWWETHRTRRAIFLGKATFPKKT